MKIVIYGVSRSGKDYLLEKLIHHLNTQNISAFHIKGSTTLNELSNQLYGISLKQASEQQRTILRQKFIDVVDEYAKSYDVVFVDGHYAFIEKMGFNIVLTDADKYCYDHFFYLDTLTEKIVEFSRKYPRQPQDLTIQADEIDKWKHFEIKGLSNICNELNKELVILDENTQSCIEFITCWVKNFHHCFDYPSIAHQLVRDLVNNHHTKYAEAILLDCDNTLSINDSTYDFCDILGIKKSSLKYIFNGDRYSSYQFFQVQSLYQKFDDAQLEEAINYAISQIQLSDDVWQFIEQHKNQSYICALTAGIFNIWENKANKLGNIDKVWGNTIHAAQQFFVTPLLKKHIALNFQKFGIKVTAIGDSMIDIPMLESAEYGYIVAHQKLNRAVCQYLSDQLNTNIQQIFANEWYYPITQYEIQGE
ncbi:MAG: haloacid dehalogenase-like hydrolase [Lonepinella koalarum]|nr:haloacid dehalogenase-like hydrolase [Lonepinella koalarum]